MELEVYMSQGLSKSSP